MDRCYLLAEQAVERGDHPLVLRLQLSRQPCFYFCNGSCAQVI